MPGLAPGLLSQAVPGNHSASHRPLGTGYSLPSSPGTQSRAKGVTLFSSSSLFVCLFVLFFFLYGFVSRDLFPTIQLCGHKYFLLVMRSVSLNTCWYDF